MFFGTDAQSNASEVILVQILGDIRHPIGILQEVPNDGGKLFGDILKAVSMVALFYQIRF